jgi:hypothetical protein
MNITIYETVSKKVNIDRKQMKEITVSYLKSMVDPGEYIREEKGKLVVKRDEQWNRHGSIMEEYVRDACEFDIAIFDMLKLLRVVEE